MALSMSNNSPHSPFSIDAEKLEQNRLWQRFSRFFGRDDHPALSDQRIDHGVPEHVKPSLGRRLSRKVVPGLPRPATFRRQNSERREKLTPVNQSGAERRVQSMDRRRAKSARPASPSPAAIPKISAPALLNPEQGGTQRVHLAQGQSQPSEAASRNSASNGQQQQQQRPMPPPSPPPENQIPPPEPPPIDDDMDDQISQELDERWILNLSMHFRDRSPREKFFVTYAETSTRWRRVTVSCDYRDAPPDSLEKDLQALTLQREKSSRIYEAIRASLPDIQFYPTVTNLRLETSEDDRLHVHVTEDVNEIIPYPSVTTVQHLDYQSVSEHDVAFDSHMSGFVYRVRVNSPDFDDKLCIKKEIPGPDSVEEFLYEINALYQLNDQKNVINFEGLVIDEENGLVKGLLISYAEHGPLIDLIYDFKGTGDLTWKRREKWAREIIVGLSELHEAGFVQGDFTLSNIVVDDNDTAQIIDINRRGCPVGWEPPEVEKMIPSGQRIYMYIGVKSDLFQLGMVLWGLAREIDEPEKQQRPLKARDLVDAPQYFRDIVNICLSENPKDRLPAKELLFLFPEDPGEPQHPLQTALRRAQGALVPEIQNIDPTTAVAREDIIAHSGYRRAASHGFSDAPTYVNRPSSLEMPFDGPGSYMISRSRGRSPPGNTRHLDRSYSGLSIGRHLPDAMDEDEPQIVPISPPGPNRTTEINPANPEWDLMISEMDSEEDEDERERRHIRRRERMQSAGNSPNKSTMAHMDSGLADMGGPSQLRSMVEHVDSGLADMDLADMDLAGIGENDMLKAHHDGLDLAKEIESLSAGSAQHTQPDDMDIDLGLLGHTAEYSQNSTDATGVTQGHAMFNGSRA